MSVIKNKKQSLILLTPIFLTIWGIIGYKISRQISWPGVSLENPHVEKQVTAFVPDTIDFDLVLNYHDPFLTSEPSGKPWREQKNKFPKPVEKPSQPKTINDIKYHGIIKLKQNKSIVLLSKDNKYHRVQKQQQFAGWEVFFVSKDSVGLKNGLELVYLKIIEKI